MPFRLKICGAETLTTLETREYYLEINLSRREDPYVIDTSVMFSNDDLDCPITKYSLSSTNTSRVQFEALTGDAALNFEIDNTGSFTVTPTKTGYYEVYVMAETESAVVTFKHFIFNMTLNCDLIDTNPMWETRIMRNESSLEIGSIDLDLLEVWSFDDNYRPEITAEYCKVTSY